MALQDRLVSLELLVQMELLDQMDSLDLLVQLDCQGSQVHKVTLADQVLQASLDRLAHVALLGHQDNLAKPVYLANRDLKELQVQRASRDHQVHLDSQDCKVQQELQATQVDTLVTVK